MAIQINGTTVIDNSKNLTNIEAGEFNGKVTSAQTVASDSVSTLATKGYVDSNSGGSGEGTVYNGAVAWANTNRLSPTTLEGSLNVASIVSTGTGIFTATFTNAMPNADYSVVGTVCDTGGNNPYVNFQVTSQSSNSFTFVTGVINYGNGGMSYQNTGVNFAVFATNAAVPKGGTGIDAWASVKRTTSNGPCVIESSFNIASVTRTGEGTYDYVFTAPMPDANYAVQITCFNEGDGPTYLGIGSVYSKTASGFILDVRAYTNNNLNDRAVSIAVNATNATLPQTVTQEQIDAAANNPGASAWGDVDKDGNLLQGNNISSVVRNSKSVYDVTFTKPMPNANYAVVITPNSGSDIASGSTRNAVANTKTATGFRCTVKSGGKYEDTDFSFAIFATNALPPRRGTGADAWVTADSSQNITGSFNVASVTKQSTGKYLVTFTTPMPDQNYAAVCTAASFTSYVTSRTATSFVVNVKSASSDFDAAISVVVHATNATLPTTFTEAQIQGVIDSDPKGIAKAWANFNGYTMAIRDSLNVNSITDNGVGYYIINYNSNMPNANYCCSIEAMNSFGGALATYTPTFILSVDNIAVGIWGLGSNRSDATYVNVVVHSR